jgi:hypothetical protein
VTGAPQAASVDLEDHPTMPKLTPLSADAPEPVSFPPLEPFAPFAGHEMTPPEVPKPVVSDGPPTVSPAAAFVPPPLEAPKKPEAPKPPPFTPPDVRPEPAAPLDVEPQPAAPSGEASNRLLAAIGSAQQLIESLQAMASTVRQSEADANRMRSRIEELEHAERMLRQAREVLASAPQSNVSADQVNAASDVVRALEQNPNDFQVHMQLAQQGQTLAAAISDYAELRQFLDRLARALGG